MSYTSLSSILTAGSGDNSWAYYSADFEIDGTPSRLLVWDPQRWTNLSFSIREGRKQKMLTILESTRKTSRLTQHGECFRRAPGGGGRVHLDPSDPSFARFSNRGDVTCFFDRDPNPKEMLLLLYPSCVS
jgi:hypothetical protein